MEIGFAHLAMVRDLPKDAFVQLKRAANVLV